MGAEVPSVQVQLCANDDLYLLIERAGDSQAKLVYVPVNADYGLLGQYFFIKKFEASCHSYRQIVLIFD